MFHILFILGSVCRFYTKCRRLIAHRELQFSTTNDVFEVDITAGIGFSIQLNTLDIHVFFAVVMRNNAERFAISNVHGCLIKERRTKDITASGRLNLIETQGRKNVPSRHLTDIFIAA